MQEYQLWFGFAFAAILVAFLMYVVAFGRTLDAQRMQIIRFLCALCAGFAGALITGDALVRFNIPVGTGGRFFASGTAGFALFMLVWLTFKQVLPDGMNLRIPEGWQFRAAVDAIVQQDKAVAEFIGFTAEELKAPLRGAEFEKTTVVDSLVALRSLATGPGVRPYKVSASRPRYILEIV